MLLSITANAQFLETLTQDLYIGIGFDPKMAIEGPGYSYDGKSSTFNYEVRLGWEQDLNDIVGSGIRIEVSYEDHHEINYYKITLPRIDYKLNDFILRNLDGYAGIEISTIHRKTNSYVRNEKSFSFGVNFELQYHIADRYAIGVGTNWFLAEHALIVEDKITRYDTMVSLYYKF